MGEIHASELRALQTAHVEGAEVLASVHDEVVERRLRACAADVERTERREVAQVERLQDGVADIGEVKPHDARGTVDVLRVVDDEVGVEGELHLRPLVGCEDRALVWRARGIAITEIIPL